MPEMKTLNGYEVVDAKARQDIEDIMGANLASEEYVDEAIAAIPKPDYTGLATEAYVDNAIDNIPEVDLSKHALKSELPTKVSQLQNDSKFITREEVPETDLSAYAKKSEIPDVSDFITSIPSEYITESELNAKGYLTQHQDISGKADKNHKHTEYLTEHQDISHLAPKSSIPTKVSQLANDSNYLTSIPSTYITEAELEAKNYLTEHQSLAAYATKTFVENTVAENQPNLSGYAKKSDIPDVSDFISEIPSEYVTDSELVAKKYATESYVGEAIAQAQLGGEEVDLSDYAKKADVPTKTSQLTNDSNFLTAIPSEYITDTELNNKGYLTEHQSLDGKADKVHEHTEYANKTHNHSMADITDYVAPEIPSLDGYATEKYVDDAVAGIDISESTPEVYHLDMRGVVGSASVNAPDSHIEVLNKIIAGDPICIYIRLSDMETWPARTCKYSDTSVVVETTPGHNTNTGDVFKEICSYSLENGVWKIHKTSPSTPRMVTEAELTSTLANYASTSYVDEAIAGIESGGSGAGGPSAHLIDAKSSLSALSDKDKEVLQYIIEQTATNKAIEDYRVFYRLNNNSIIFELTYFEKVFEQNQLLIVGHDDNGYIMKLTVGYDSSTYAPTSFKAEYAKMPCINSIESRLNSYGTWEWHQSNFDDSLWHVQDYAVYNVRHMKLVGQDISSGHYFTIDISAPGTQDLCYNNDSLEFKVPFMMNGAEVRAVTREGCWYLMNETDLTELETYKAVGCWFWE